MAGRWENTGRAVLAALTALLLTLSLPGGGAMEAARLLPFAIGQLLRLALAALTAV